MATASEDTIMEEIMVSPQPPNRLHHPTRKIALPIDHQPPFPNSPSLPETCSLEVSFNGWRPPQKDWKAWIDRMLPLHESTWKKAGIYHAVLNSSYEIEQNQKLILGFAEKWHQETNTFVFSWGEATITLEDTMNLGGYSVLGESVHNPLEKKEFETILAKLLEARAEFIRSKAKKVSQMGWLKKFKDSGSEIEHEAFLIFWLSRFVFPSSYSTIVKNVFSIAVSLANGTQLALGPAVLATIYRDLSSIKSGLLNSMNNDHKDEASVTVWAPLQLVQVWIWERFPKFRPVVSNPDDRSMPRFARWEKKNLHVKNVGSVLNQASKDFVWRPYAENDNRFDEVSESWARCLRVSELVGIEGSCIEQYLPHRVAMQFGMDQDTHRSSGVHDLRSSMGDYERSESFYDGESRNEGSLGGTGTSDLPDNEASNEIDEVYTMGLELEARIKKIEEVFVHLKAKKNVCS